MITMLIGDMVIVIMVPQWSVYIKVWSIYISDLFMIILILTMKPEYYNTYYYDSIEFISHLKGGFSESKLSFKNQIQNIFGINIESKLKFLKKKSIVGRNNIMVYYVFTLW